MKCVYLTWEAKYFFEKGWTIEANQPQRCANLSLFMLGVARNNATIRLRSARASYAGQKSAVSALVRMRQRPKAIIASGAGP